MPDRWHALLIPELGRHRPGDLRFWDQPSLQSEFQDSYIYTEKSFLKKQNKTKKNEKKKQEKINATFLLLHFDAVTIQSGNIAKFHNHTYTVKLSSYRK